MNALIDFKQVLASAKQHLRLRNSDNDIWLMDLINQGARDLSTNETLIIVDCTATITDQRFYLPKDCKKVLAFRSKDSCIPGIFVDMPFFKNCNCSIGQFSSLIGIMDINGRWANMINTVPDGTEIEIAYQKVNTDDSGLVIINEEMYTALTMYACSWFANAYVENYTAEQRRTWARKYEFQANKCRGLAGRRKFVQGQDQIRKIMGTMVNASSPFRSLTGTYQFFYPSISNIPAN